MLSSRRKCKARLLFFSQSAFSSAVFFPVLLVDAFIRWSIDTLYNECATKFPYSKDLRMFSRGCQSSCFILDIYKELSDGAMLGSRSAF